MDDLPPDAERQEQAADRLRRSHRQQAVHRHCGALLLLLPALRERQLTSSNFEA